LTAYFVLSSVSEFWFVTVVGGLKLPQTWHQQRVSGPHDLAVRFGVFARRDETIAPDAKASIASRAQRFVTIAKRPSGGHETAELVEMMCPTAKAEYFSLMVWTDFW